MSYSTLNISSRYDSDLYDVVVFMEMILQLMNTYIFMLHQENIIMPTSI